MTTNGYITDVFVRTLLRCTVGRQCRTVSTLTVVAAGAKVIANGYLNVMKAVASVPKPAARLFWSPSPSPAATTVIGPGAGAEGVRQLQGCFAMPHITLRACTMFVHCCTQRHLVVVSTSTFHPDAHALSLASTFAHFHVVVRVFVLLKPYSLTPPTNSNSSSLLSCTGGIVAAPGPDVSVSIEATQPPPSAAAAPSLPLSAMTVASELINSLVTPSPVPPPPAPPRPAGPSPATAPLSPAPGLHVSQTLSADGPLPQAPPCICQEADAPAQQGRRLLDRRSSSRRSRSREDSRRRLSSIERRL